MADHGRVITAKLPQPLVIQLDEVVERIDRSKSWVVREALSEWLGQDQRRQELAMEAIDPSIVRIRNRIKCSGGHQVSD